MNKYKIEITKTFCIDVFAKDEETAKSLAERGLENLEATDQQHNYQTGDTDFIVYDVTDTEDPFSPIDCEHIYNSRDKCFYCGELKNNN